MRATSAARAAVGSSSTTDIGGAPTRAPRLATPTVPRLRALVRITSPSGPPTHPDCLRCSSVEGSDHSPSSRLASRASRRPRWRTYSDQSPKERRRSEPTGSPIPALKTKGRRNSGGSMPIIFTPAMGKSSPAGDRRVPAGPGRGAGSERRGGRLGRRVVPRRVRRQHPLAWRAGGGYLAEVAAG